MKTRPMSRTLLFLVALIVLAFSAVGLISPESSASGRSMPGVTGQPVWSTYTDKRFDFTIEYPAGWHVYPRNDAPGGYGGTLSFSSLPAPDGPSKQKPGEEARTVVTVGFYLAAMQPNQSLSVWTDLYGAKAKAHSPSESQVTERKEVLTPQWKGLLLSGRTRQGPFHATNVPNGQVIWFVWTNAGTADLPTYHHMVNTLRFGETSPRTLQAACGEGFRPVLLDVPLDAVGTMDATNGCPTNMAGDPSGFRLPFSGQRTITTAPGCYSTHQGADCECIDYGMPTGTSVLAPREGTVTFMGWTTEGGLVLDISHPGNYSSHYAHLDRYQDVIDVGTPVYHGQVVADSGNTGHSEGPHLHFGVYDTTNIPWVAVWIRTLPTTVWWSGDPSTPCLGWDVDDHGYAVGS